MATNNLRVIYNNLANNATITSSVTATGVTAVANIKVDSKSLVCRTAGTAVTFTVTLATASTVGGVVLPFCNLTSTATINVSLLNGVTNLLTTGAILACPYQNLGGSNWGTVPTGANGYAYGSGTYGRVWFTQTANVTSLTITITDTSNTAGYLEFSRLVVGQYWSPTYNTEYGLSNGMKDLTTHERTEAGDLVSNRGVRSPSMNFTVNNMLPTDRLSLYSIFKFGGLSNPLLISLFPDNTTDWSKERDYMIYGKLPQFNEIVHPIYNMYNSSIEIEEI